MFQFHSQPSIILLMCCLCSFAVQFLLFQQSVLVSSVPLPSPTFQLGYQEQDCNLLETKILMPGYLCVCVHTPPRSLFDLLPHPHYPLRPSTHTSWNCLILGNVPKNEPPPQHSQPQIPPAPLANNSQFPFPIPTVPPAFVPGSNSQFQIPPIPENPLQMYISTNKTQTTTTSKPPKSSTTTISEDEEFETETNKPTTNSTTTSTTTTVPTTTTKGTTTAASVTAAAPEAATNTATTTTTTTTTTEAPTTTTTKPAITTISGVAVTTVATASESNDKKPAVKSATAEPAESESE